MKIVQSHFTVRFALLLRRRGFTFDGTKVTKCLYFPDMASLPYSETATSMSLHHVT